MEAYAVKSSRYELWNGELWNFGIFWSRLDQCATKRTTADWQKRIEAIATQSSVMSSFFQWSLIFTKQLDGMVCTYILSFLPAVWVSLSFFTREKSEHRHYCATRENCFIVTSSSHIFQDAKWPITNVSNAMLSATSNWMGTLAFLSACEDEFQNYWTGAKCWWTRLIS